MRRRLIVLLLVLLPLPVFAASGLFVGVEAGYNYDIIDTATGWAGTQNSNGHGFDISVPVEYRVNDWFSVNSGLRWIMRSSGYRKSYSDAGGTFVADDYVKMHHAIEIPLTVRFSLPLDDFRLFIGGGGYIGVRTLDVDAGSSYLTASDAEERGYWERYYQHIAFEADDNLFDAGLIAEAGASYEFGDYGSLYLLGRYQYGLTSLAKDSRMAAHSYFDSISVDVGFMWRII